MAIKFEKVTPGMILLDVHKQRMGNTTMTQWGLWKVRVITLSDTEALVSWNGNPPEIWPKRRIEKLYAKEPKCYRDQRQRDKERYAALAVKETP